MTTLLVRLLAGVSVVAGVSCSIYVSLTTSTPSSYFLAGGILLAGLIGATLLAVVAELLDRIRRISILLDPPSIKGTSIEEKLGLSTREVTSEPNNSQ